MKASTVEMVNEVTDVGTRCIYFNYKCKKNKFIHGGSFFLLLLYVMAILAIFVNFCDTAMIERTSHVMGKAIDDKVDVVQTGKLNKKLHEPIKKNIGNTRGESGSGEEEISDKMDERTKEQSTRSRRRRIRASGSVVREKSSSNPLDEFAWKAHSNFESIKQAGPPVDHNLHSSTSSSSSSSSPSSSFSPPPSSSSSSPIGEASNLLQCSQQEYLCLGGQVCISGTFYCDGFTDCPLGDDENTPACRRLKRMTHQQLASSPSTSSSSTSSSSSSPSMSSPPLCPLGYLHCSKSSVKGNSFHLSCVPLALVCNGVNDCPSGEDEIHCTLDREAVNTPQSTILSFPGKTDTEESLNSPVTQATLMDHLANRDYPSIEDQYNKGKGIYVPKKPTSKDNDTRVNVKATKLIPSSNNRPISYSHTGSGYFFINFGNIINGNENVNGQGNDYGNGNGNGNANGNKDASRSISSLETGSSNSEKQKEHLVQLDSPDVDDVDEDSAPKGDMAQGNFQEKFQNQNFDDDL